MARMSLQTAFDQARQWLETNDLDRAIGMAHHILETYPHCLEAHQMLGEAHLANRQYEEARADFERVLTFDPEHIPALVGLGMTCERLGQLDRAISAFERALEIKPDLPELRSQLLRLYTDAWGSEYAHLRLSRAGLARLYAKGHMLPQAISEFRQVVADQPDRFDSRVALAEVLWRDEQEEEAAEVCRSILAKQSNVLKANLILGYIELAAGNPSGEQFWKTAAAIDPYQSMARALFESLPPVDVPEPTLPEWDETEWFNRQVAAPAEQLAATRSMESTTPTAVAAPPPPPPSAPPLSYADSDDFLASLLAIDAAPPVVSHPVEEAEVEISSDTRPFTIEELGLSEAELASLGALEEEPSGPAEVSTQVEPVASAATPAESSEVSAMRPFTLDELGLTPDEIAALDSASTAAPASQPSQLEDFDIDAQPFSLDDIDFERGGHAPAAGRDVGSGAGDVPPDLQPFSIEELDIGSMSGQADFGELPPSLQPFSLEEPPAPQRPRMAGLTPEEAGETPIEEEDTFLPRGFSWQQPTQRAEPSFFQSTSAASTPDTGTIFSKLQKQRERAPLSQAEEPPPPPIAPDEHLGLFSLDDVSLRDDESPESGAPSFTAEPPVESQPPDDSGQFQAISLEEVESVESAVASGVIQPFSFTDLGLTDEEIAALGLGSAPEASAAQTGFGLTDEEIAALGLDSASEAPAARAEMSAPVQEEPPVMAASPVEAPVMPPALEPPPRPLEEVESIEDALASGQLQPFSFTDLGLSEEEIAALGLGDLGGAAQSPVSVEPEPLTESAPEIEMSEASQTPEPFVEPLTGGGEAPAPKAAAEPVIEESLGIEELQPFSLTDLGLSEEELAEFDLSDLEEEGVEYDEGRLGITEEELAALGTGGDLEWMPELTPVSEPPAAAFEPVEPAPEAIGGDDVVDRLIQIGRERGYVDIADIIAAVKDPEAEAARIDEIGRMLHMARIEIRDGDEVIDLDAEYAEDESPLMPEDAVAPAAFEAEEEDLMRPFSLEELGLSDDEIAMLAAAAAGGAEETPPAEESSLTPFSLEESDAADDEIAMIAASSVEEAPPAEEPPLTPFSLAELGLSEEEIALLNETAASFSASPSPAAEVETETAAWFDLEPVVADTEAAPLPEPPAPDLAEAPTPTITPAPASSQRIEQPPAPPAAPVSPPAPPAMAVKPPPAPSAAPVSPPAPPPAVIHDPSDYPELQEYLQMLESDPNNHILRLSIARVGGQVGMTEIAMQHYRRLIKQNALLDEIVDDLTDMIAETSDTNLLRKLHRTLGDAYSRQGRFRDAMREYSWIPGQA